MMLVLHRRCKLRDLLAQENEKGKAESNQEDDKGAGQILE